MKDIVGLEELHITNREDGKGHQLTAKGTWNNEPKSITIPLLQRLNFNICNNETYKGVQKSNPNGYYLYDTFFRDVSLKIDAKVVPEEGKYFTITIDPEFYAKKQLQELENEIKEIKHKTNERVEELLQEIEKLQRLV